MYHFNIIIIYDNTHHHHLQQHPSSSSSITTPIIIIIIYNNTHHHHHHHLQQHPLSIICYILSQHSTLIIMKKLQLTLNKKYASSTRIGLGVKSETYLGYELSTEKEIAIKLERVDENEPSLERQAKFYRIIKGGVGIPNLYWFGIENNFRTLVIDIYGPSLEQLLKYCKGVFSLKTVLLIADQLLERIEWVHSKGLVYNDIEAENFLVGLGDKQDKIFMIDFGSCQKYLNQEGQHLKFELEIEQVKSNPKFRSIFVHTHKRAGRRDDLQSLGYMLVYFLKGKLPWDEVDPNEDSQLAIKQKKVSVPIDLLCENLPQQFNKYFEYVRTLEYEEEPDYIWLRQLFKDLFEDKGFVNNRVMDWAERHKH